MKQLYISENSDLADDQFTIHNTLDVSSAVYNLCFQKSIRLTIVLLNALKSSPTNCMSTLQWPSEKYNDYYLRLSQAYKDAGFHYLELSHAEFRTGYGANYPPGKEWMKDRPVHEIKSINAEAVETGKTSAEVSQLDHWNRK